MKPDRLEFDSTSTQIFALLALNLVVNNDVVVLLTNPASINPLILVHEMLAIHNLAHFQAPWFF